MHRTTTGLAELLERRPASAPDLLCAVIEHGHNDGARLVASFGIELPEPGPITGGGAGDEHDVGAVLDLAARVAAELGDVAIGPEHVVLAVAEDDAVDPAHAGMYRVLGLRSWLLRDQLARLRAGRTDLLDPEPDEAYLAEVEAELYRLAES